MCRFYVKLLLEETGHIYVETNKLVVELCMVDLCVVYMPQLLYHGWINLVLTQGKCLLLCPIKVNVAASCRKQTT